MNILFYIFLCKLLTICYYVEGGQFFISIAKNNIEMLNNKPGEYEKKKKFFRKVNLELKPLVNKVIEKYKLNSKYHTSINKDLKFKKILSYLHLKKIHEIIEKFINDLEKNDSNKQTMQLFLDSDLGNDLDNDLDNDFDEIVKKTKIFLKKYNEIINQNCNLKNKKIIDFDFYFKNYAEEFVKIRKMYSRIFNIRNNSIYISAFKNENIKAALNKFKILEKIIYLKNKISENKLNHTNWNNLIFNYVKLNFEENSNFTIDEVLTCKRISVQSTKSNNTCEVKEISINAGKQKNLHKNIIELIKSIHTLKEAARNADKFDFEQINEGNLNPLNQNVEKSRISAYKIAVNIFLKNLKRFFNEIENSVTKIKKAKVDVNLLIIINILKLKFDTRYNFQKHVNNLFELMLNSELFWNDQIEKYYNYKSFEEVEKFLSKHNSFYLTIETTDLTFFTLIKEGESLEKYLFKYLN